VDNVVLVILGPAMIVGGMVLYRGSGRAYERAFGAATATAGAVMAFIGLVNALAGTG
jgi:hypothetical protein